MMTFPYSIAVVTSRGPSGAVTRIQLGIAGTSLAPPQSSTPPSASIRNVASAIASWPDRKIPTSTPARVTGVPGGGNAPSTRTGTSVACKAGYEKESAVLVTTLNGLGVPSTAEAVPNPLPAGFDAAANCYVLLGK